ncbi:DUF262 domain-containing protein [Helicobacter sp. 23-1048]
MADISGEQTLSSLFNGNFYRIPDYQRGYAWGEEQLEDFWQDLENSKGHKHYTGVLSLAKVDDEEKKKSEWVKDKAASEGEAYYIVDGQQRLTTSMILLKVILDFVDSDEFAGEETQDLRKKYIGKKRGGEQYYFFGYTFDNPSHKFLRSKIFGDEISEGIEESIYTKNLEFAKEFFKKKINKENIEEVFKTLTQNFVFNVYQISDSFDVFVAFETMNNRGKLLSSLELLKNRLIYLSTKLDDEGDYLRNEINTCWKEVYKFLGKNSKNVLQDDEFLKVHWLMYFDAYERKSGEPHRSFLLKEHFITTKVMDKKLGAEDIKSYAMNLKDCVEHYYFLHNLNYPEYKNRYKINDDIIKWLEKIQRLNFGAFEPLLVAVLYKRAQEIEKGNSFDDSAFVELLKHIEKFLFLMFRISYRQANFKEQDICKNAYLYFRNEKTIDEIKYFIKEIYFDSIELGQLKAKVETYFREQRGGYFAWKGLRYFLFEYEECLREDNKRNTNKISWKWEDFTKSIKDSTTIEHILPQTPESNSEWETMLNQTPGIKGKQEKARKANIHQLTNSLGNLVPLSQPLNSELGRKPFEQKVERYKEGSYAEIEISQSKKWDKQAIENRSEKLLDFMFERWGINEIIKSWENNDDEREKGQRQIQKDLIFHIF